MSVLKKYFEHLINQASERIKFCFFIDGLDEYEGGHADIAEYLSQMSKRAFVKLCISSRPWPSLKHAFENRPQLRLQDLTSSDIDQYIHDELKDSKRMAYLTEKEPVHSIGLFKDVVNKADGVFLWVTLVVKSVLKGLTNKYSVYYLEKRLQSVPADLEDLYDHMLARIDAEYMVEASRIFQLMEHEGGTDMENVYQAYAADLPRTVQMNIRTLEEQEGRTQEDEVSVMCEEMEFICRRGVGSWLR
jgi:hypothetical protein